MKPSNNQSRKHEFKGAMPLIWPRFFLVRKVLITAGRHVSEQIKPSDSLLHQPAGIAQLTPGYFACICRKLRFTYADSAKADLNAYVLIDLLRKEVGIKSPVQRAIGFHIGAV